MISFWISAALVSAATAALIVSRAARGVQVNENPALAIYRRQLSEIDEMLDHGLLPDSERRSAHAEAARRLLAAADTPAATSLAAENGRGAVLAVAGLAPLVALAVYLSIGSPQAPDQPYSQRLAAWRMADPASLTPGRMAAVLRLLASQRPDDPKVFYYLARAQMAEGDDYSAIRSLERSTSLDPKAPGPRYYLARARIAAGDAAGGLAAWRALRADLAPDDPRRQALDQEITVVERTHALPGAAPAAP